MNLGKIKNYAKVVLVVVVKAGNVLEILEEELGDTLSDKLANILPQINSALAVVRDSLSKILVFFGEDVTEEVTALSESSVEAELSDLSVAVEKLKGL